MFGKCHFNLAFPQGWCQRRAELARPNQGEQGVNENAGAPYAVEIQALLSPLANSLPSSPPGVMWQVADLRTGEVTDWNTEKRHVYDMTARCHFPLNMGVPGAIGGPIITGWLAVAFLASGR